MAGKIKYYDTSRLEMKDMGQAVDAMMNTCQNGRRNFERKWYDNNFFDDGHHFRFLNRQQNKIIDLSEKASLYSPMRAIPKAPRQIRGIANLITSQDYIPIVYPERVQRANYQEVQDPQTGENISPEYEQAMEESKKLAKRVGHWLTEEFKNQDLTSKFALMSILSAKNFVSYLQIMPDAEKEKLVTIVRDAFDVYLLGDLTDPEESPFVVIAHPKNIAEIKANEMFDEEQLSKINPDNRQANSEIKEAYMKNKFGREFNDDSSASVILKEAYIKEHLCEENIKRINKQEDSGDILKGKKHGDIIIRQSFTAGNIELYDKYLDLPGYPIVDFRYEPGPMYGISLIERFIPTNKSLDVVMSRIERYTNSQPLGVIAKRKGEDYKINNVAGGQVVEYKGTPPIFQTQQNLPPAIFEYINILNSFIEEQGVSTATLGQIPAGVKAAKAIESLKESEFANLVIAQRQFKNMIKKVAEKFLDYADKYFVTPQTVYLLEKGEPSYFDIIGKSAMKKREDLKVPVEGDVTPISKEYKVEIEVQSGLGYTREGKKAAAKELGDYLIQVAQMGLIPPEVMTQYINTLLETYQFGGASEVMEKMEKFNKEGQVSDSQMEKIKVAIAEVMKDLGMAGKEAEEAQIETTKVGVVEALRDTGLIDKDNSGGLEAEKVKQEMQIKREKADAEMMKMQDKTEMEKTKVEQDVILKDEKAKEDSMIKRAQAMHKMKMSEKMAEKTPKKKESK